VIVIDQGITRHTKFNCKNVQTCSFKGNLLAESVQVHSTEVGKGGKIDCNWPSYSLTHKIKSAYA